MIITAVALILPTALYSTFETTLPLDLDKQILAFSRGTALVLFVLYLVYLYFEFVSHKDLFDPPKECTTHHGAGNSNVPTEQDTQPDTQQDSEQDSSTSSSLFKAFAALIASAAGIMSCSHFLLDSINKTSEATGITRTFIATILIPIASNAPECATVVSSHSVDFSVGVIVGSILQIALFVIPVLVILGWAVGKGMTLNFETFQTVILFMAILLVNHLLQNGKYTYMHGLMLVGL
jgi:Ca2+:H+ antiporter